MVVIPCFLRTGKRIKAMMGEPVGRQDRLFYDFDLEEMVPVDHLLRRVDAALDLSWLRGEMAPHYSHLGCPSVCPELMVRMLIVGYRYPSCAEYFGMRFSVRTLTTALL